MPTDPPPTDPQRIQTEALWEELGGDLCICQRPDVPHWCEKCQQRLQLIQKAMDRVRAAERQQATAQQAEIVKERDALAEQIRVWDTVTLGRRLVQEKAEAEVASLTQQLAERDQRIAGFHRRSEITLDHSVRNLERAVAAEAQLAEARRQIATLTEAAQPFADEKACEEEPDRCLDDSGPWCQMHDHWYVGDSTKRLRDVLNSMNLRKIRS